MHHSDHGAPHLSIRYTERLANAEIAPAVDIRGDSDANALAGSVIGLFETARIRRRRPWRNIEEIECAALALADRFNTRRLVDPIACLPPAGRSGV